ncbi:hypothetical protein BVRB_2g041150 [Beta vulgaris subsp. vulgaris]|nr:hypothetical protein BVRB_2g041150 [Beta vulgaris subsp. vulgaris]
MDKSLWIFCIIDKPYYFQIEYSLLQQPHEEFVDLLHHQLLFDKKLILPLATTSS